MSIFNRLSQGLKRSRDGIASMIPQGQERLTDADWEDIEDALVMADCGAHLAAEMVELAKKDAKTPRASLARAMRSRLRCDKALNEPISGPFVLLVVGVNGTGKTTTIGKLATMYRQQGKKVLVGAADTFRAAAVEQLEVWVNRAGADIVKQHAGADPASVAFDTVQRGVARGYDVVIIDTAGRVQTDKGLMDELAKVRRVIAKVAPDTPHEVWHVVDGGTGQNALAQVAQFREVAGTTGLIVTKLDGTAKGGILLQLVERFMLPIRYVGVGETLEDLMPFDAEIFSNSLMSLTEQSSENT